MLGLGSTFTIPVEEKDQNENHQDNDKETSDVDSQLETQNEEDPLAGKYFPPMYEATERTLPPLTNSKYPEKLKKSNFILDLTQQQNNKSS
jgi:hypothetical protein